MKKSVILTIAVIYILAIVIVGFLGIRMNVYDEKVYVDEILIISDNYKKYDPNTLLGAQKINDGYSGYFQESFKQGLKIEVKCQVKPDNASIKKVIYSQIDSQDCKLIVKEDGTAVIEFYRGTVVDLIISSADSVGKSIKIQIQVNDFGDL